MDTKDYIEKYEGMKLSIGKTWRKINSTFNDVHIDDTNGVKICTSEINYFVSEVDFVLEDDLTCWCFTTEYDTRLYSYPPKFKLGVTHPMGFGYIPTRGWEEEMSEAGINPDIIKKAKNMLASKPPIGY